MKRFALAWALLGLLLGCGAGEGNGSSPPGQTPPNPDLGNTEIWKLELMLADRASYNAIQQSGPSSWSIYFAPDGSMFRPGVGEIEGREAVHEAFMEDIYSGAVARLQWSPSRAEVSASGDLGYTVGEYVTVGVDSAGVRTSVGGLYVRIWSRQSDGEWRVKTDIRNPTIGPDTVGVSGPG